MRKVPLDNFDELSKRLGMSSKRKTRVCYAEDCEKDGEFPAPQSPEHLREYFFFCQEHVTQYNRAWNYYSGLDQSEIEKQINQDTRWQRPTWPLGTHRNKGDAGRLGQVDDGFGDPFGLFKEESEAKEQVYQEFREPRTPTERALHTLQITGRVDMKVVKARYKEMVKRHHPDRNNGDKASEEKIRAIIEAYSLLKKNFEG
jgi:hypothetical protein